jgi:hypothetical protein
MFPDFTPVAPVNPVPVIVMTSPWQTIAGEKDVMVGGCAPTERQFPNIKKTQRITATNFLDGKKGMVNELVALVKEMGVKLKNNPFPGNREKTVFSLS